MIVKTLIQTPLGKVASVLGLCAILSMTAHAATIVTSASDFEPRFNTSTTLYDPGPSTTAVTLRTGFQTNFQINSAYFFQLPVLAPEDVITGASFSVTEMPDSATSAVTPTFNADLVALGFTNAVPPANTAAESQAYFYLGEGAFDLNPGVGAGAVRAQIQNNFLVPGDFIPNGGTAAVKQTSAAGSAALLSYINLLYTLRDAGGIMPGTSSLILRLNQDTTVQPSGTQRYTLASAENMTTGILLPTLTLEITPVPEPSSVALSALGAAICGWAMWRRRALRRC